MPRIGPAADAATVEWVRRSDAFLRSVSVRVSTDEYAVVAASTRDRALRTACAAFAEDAATDAYALTAFW